ncbi:type II toxin-antitoxin system Phd/YefM family antitoxin [Candidatus Leptofilum sp.]|uniref:type II toxin-antitoxin system Phd/YefM family antitoxin n=1 Tax=Candidatus Leptofilum sp. TaxID=3241576 RepID=UPI003B5B7450
MTTIKMSSDEARSKWREVIDTAVAGNHVVIERYGKPVVTIIAHAEYETMFEQESVLREAAAVYQIAPQERDSLKADLLKEITAELLAKFSKQAISNADDPVNEQSVSKAAKIFSPRLAYPEQSSDFKKEIVTE